MGQNKWTEEQSAKLPIEDLTITKKQIAEQLEKNPDTEIYAEIKFGDYVMLFELVRKSFLANFRRREDDDRIKGAILDNQIWLNTNFLELYGEIYLDYLDRRNAKAASSPNTEKEKQ